MNAQVFADAQSRQAKLANDAIIHRQQTNALQQIDPVDRLQMFLLLPLCSNFQLTCGVLMQYPLCCPSSVSFLAT